MRFGIYSELQCSPDQSAEDVFKQRWHWQNTLTTPVWISTVRLNTISIRIFRFVQIRWRYFLRWHNEQVGSTFAPCAMSFLCTTP